LVPMVTNLAVRPIGTKLYRAGDNGLRRFLELSESKCLPDLSRANRIP
jgi:hypothetical protein